MRPDRADDISEGSAASAARDDGQHGYVPPIEMHLIRSKHVAQTFQVQVMRPACTRSETTRFPVVYATDGNLAFDMFKSISYVMQSSQADACRYILVGVGYPGESPHAGAVLRARDLIFPGYPRLSTEPPAVASGSVPEPGSKGYYGAEDFQQFLGRELIPFIDEKYRTVAGERVYFGHSAGAGFGLFTLFSRAELFNRYIVSSPGLIYHGESSAGVLYDNYDFLPRLARKFIASGQRLDGVRLYMSVGSEEQFEPALEQWRLTSSFYCMAALMQAAAIPGLELTTEVFAGETHATAWPIAFMHGIQAVFRTGAWRTRR